MSTQYGHRFATDTAEATASLASRSTSPDAISGSRMSIQYPASTSGDGECSRAGGTTIFDSSATCS
jgi:hypothetical protein